MTGITIGMTHAAALIVVALAVVLFAFRQRIEEIPVSLSPKPAPSGPATPAVTTRALHAANDPGDGFTVDVWVPFSPPDQHAPDRSPVVIYVPGWGNARGDNTLLCAELVSRGFAVVTLDDISKAPSANPTDRARDTAPFDLSSVEALDRSNANAAWRLNRMTARVSSIIDWLQTEQTANTTRSPHDRLEPSRVAVVGFSFGGSVAAEVSRLDPRVAAAINMDGWHFGTSAVLGTEKPLLVFNSDYPELQADSISTAPAKRQTASLTLTDRALQVRQAARGLSLALLFRDTDHGDFSDELFAPPLGAYLERWRRTAADRLRLRRSMERLILGFLETQLMLTRAGFPALDDDMTKAGIEILGPPPSGAVPP